MLDDLRRHERQVYSQGGEDGVLERIFEEIGTTNRHFVEFGAKDGSAISNTANLRLHHGWTGLLMDAGAPHDDPMVRREFITAENIEELFDKYGVPERPDLLSIDIDGNDYWVWKALTRYRPRVVVVEYNIFFALDDPRTVPYEPNRIWDDSCYHGASLAAFHKLGREMGYALVHTDSWYPNGFFVLRSELGDDYVERPIEELTDWGSFTAPPDPQGREWARV